MGMHLKEYSYQEIKELLAQAGFNEICAVFRIPNKWGIDIRPTSSRLYLSYLCLIENLLLLLPAQVYRRKAAKLFRLVLFSPSIFLIAQK